MNLDRIRELKSPVNKVITALAVKSQYYFFSFSSNPTGARLLESGISAWPDHSRHLNNINQL
jgi:hypothetical protein